MAQGLGGVVSQTGKSEYGRTDLDAQSSAKIFTAIPQSQKVWMSHGDAVTQAPPGFTVVASASDTSIAAFENESGLLAGVQFHPEFKSRPTRPSPPFYSFAAIAAGIIISIIFIHLYLY